MIFAEKCSVARTGIASLGWFLGRGFVQEKLTVTSDKWCVMDGAKVIAECRSKAHAERIVEALNTMHSNVKLNGR